MEEQLLEIFHDILQIDLEFNEINSDNSSWDSLAHLNIIIAIEEEFDVDIPPEDFAMLHSNLNDIIKYIKNKK